MNVRNTSPNFRTGVLSSTPDGGSIVAGLSTSFGADEHAPLVLKLDGSGNVQWQRSYLARGREWSNDIEPTSDGGYVIAGGADLGGNDVHAAALKVNPSGAIVWQQIYANGMLQAMRQTSDGGYIAAGRTDFTNGFDLLLMKLDASGLSQWRKIYSGSSTEAAADVQVAADGSYLVVGSIYSFGSRDVWVLKVNADGSIAWQKAYGGSDDDGSDSIRLTSDGGSVVAGWTSSFGAGTPNLWILKLDAAGTLIWERSYDNGATGEVAAAVEETADGGYIVAGEGSIGLSGKFFVMKLKSDGTVSGTCPAGLGAPTNAVVQNTAVVPGSGPGGEELGAFSANPTTVGVVNTQVSPQDVCP